MELDFLEQKINIPQIKNIFNQKGQSSIEFIMTFSFALGVSFLFISQSLNQTIGFVVHYATYMGGRTFLSYDNGSNELERAIQEASIAATKSFKRYGVSKFDINPKVEVITPLDNSSLFTGVTAKYDRLLSPFKLVGGSSKAVYFSEGFLGKEPTRASCFIMTCKAVGLDACEGTMDVTLFDNGC